MMKSRRIFGVEFESFNVLAPSNSETLIDKAFLSDKHNQSNLGNSFARFSLLGRSSNDSLTHESSSGNQHYIAAHFNSSMSIALLVLLGILVFMCFFSIYVRRCTPDEEDTRGNSRRGGSGNGRMRASQGLDENIIESFPLFRYSSVKGLKQEKLTQECSFCLSEFKDDETLRLLPKCRHAFHPDCIDMWLYSHTTCPLCRCSLLPEPHGAVQSLRPDLEALPQQAGAPSHENNQVVVVLGVRNGRQDGADNQGRETNEANAFDAGVCTCRTVAEQARVYNEHSTSAYSPPILGITGCLRPQEKRSHSIKRSHSTGHSLVSLGGNPDHPSEFYISTDDRHVEDFTEDLIQSFKSGLHRSSSYAAFCHMGSPGLSYPQASVNDREKLWTYPSSIEDARPCSNSRANRGQGFARLSSSDRWNISPHLPIFLRTFSEGKAPYLQQQEMASTSSTSHDSNPPDIKAFMQSFKKGFKWLRGKDKNMASLMGSQTSMRTSRNAEGDG